MKTKNVNLVCICAPKPPVFVSKIEADHKDFGWLCFAIAFDDLEDYISCLNLPFKDGKAFLQSPYKGGYLFEDSALIYNLGLAENKVTVVEISKPSSYTPAKRLLEATQNLFNKKIPLMFKAYADDYNNLSTEDVDMWADQILMWADSNKLTNATLADIQKARIDAVFAKHYIKKAEEAYKKNLGKVSPRVQKEPLFIKI